ncbi:MAG: hypothetical protein LBK43_00615 [Treponema sp.]|jgi:hypothetical protein|nr:hypothetical protein [Treponema sp.]
MAKNLVTAIELRLKDGFSRGIQRAGSATSGFAKDTLGAINMVDKALSGVGANLASLGVSLSIGAAAKEIIDLDATLMQMGVVAGMSNEQIGALKKSLFEISSDATIKLDYTNLEKAAFVITDLTGDTQFAIDNFYLMGLAIRATGSDAREIGALTAALKVAGLTADQSAVALGTFAKQASAGSFTVRDFATFGPRLISAYLATGREAQKAMSDLGVMEAIRYGVGTSDQAATAFEAVIRNLSDPQKLDALKKFGVTVDFATQSIGEVMTAIIAATYGDAKKLYEWFDAEAVRAFNYGMAEYQRNLKESGKGFVENYTKYESMAGSIADLERMAGRNAGTLKANLENIKSVFVAYIDGGSGVLGLLNDLMNALAQDPQNIERLFEAIAKGLVAITAVKGIAGVSRLIGSVGQLKSGKVNITESLSMATAMPVYVTNWSGGGSMPIGAAGFVQGTTSSTLLDQYGNPLPLPSTPTAGTPAKSSSKSPRGKIPKGLKTLGAAAMVADVAFEGYKVYQTVQDIEHSELSESEKEVVRSQAIGAAAGKTGGEVAGMVLGGLLGSLAGPGGTVVGASIGASILGFLGEKGAEALGRWRAENTEKQKTDTKGHYEYTGVNGLPVWVEPQIPIANLPPQITQTKTDLSPQKVALEGQAVMDVHVDIRGQRPTAQVAVRQNSIPMRFNTGDNADVWMIP